MKKSDPKTRFWSKVDKTPGHGPDGDCWVWTARKNDKGYGIISDRRKGIRAHRLSYEMAYGEIPPGEGYHGTCVCHRCDNPSCVRPDHLFIGPFRDNRDDCVQKRRHWYGERMSVVIRGEGHPKHRLTEQQVLAIRADRRKQRVIAEEYGISEVHVSGIKTRRCWKHI